MGSSDDRQTDCENMKKQKQVYTELELSAVISYHASDERQWAGVLPAGREGVTAGQIPAESHIGGDVLSGVDSYLSGAHSMHGGLKVLRDVIKVVKAGLVNIFLFFSSCPDYQVI